MDDDLLFDTGGDSHALFSNMAKMGIDPAGIKAVVLSHAHGDHTGGLGGRSEPASVRPVRGRMRRILCQFMSIIAQCARGDLSNWQEVLMFQHQLAHAAEMQKLRG